MCGWQMQQKRLGTSVALSRWSGPKKVSDEVQEGRQANRQKRSTPNTVVGCLNVSGCGLGPENKEMNKPSLYPRGDHSLKQTCM